MTTPCVEVRRAPKRQGRWWIITVNGQEAWREAKAKTARQVARGIRKIRHVQLAPIYNAEYVSLQPSETMDLSPILQAAAQALYDPEPLETQ